MPKADHEHNELLDGLMDLYHELMIGPCSRKMYRKESGCRILQRVEVSGEDQFDCSYDEWAEMLRDDVYRAVEAGWPGVADPEVLLTRPQKLYAARAQLTGESLVHGENYRIERKRGGWIVMDQKGNALVSIEDNGWIDEAADVDGDMILRFATAGEALATYLWTDAIGKAQMYRHRTAMKRMHRKPTDYKGKREFTAMAEKKRVSEAKSRYLAD